MNNDLKLINVLADNNTELELEHAITVIQCLPSAEYAELVHAMHAALHLRRQYNESARQSARANCFGY